MSKLDDIQTELVVNLTKIVGTSATVENVSDGISYVVDAKRQIKDLMLEMIKESYGDSLFGETTARDIFVRNLRRKVTEL